ncbi:MAG: hypothetical protein A2Y45_09620 [Tenericutes bacterium GWC2_34_14]|nr:MAG: hypothetical protein A2Z84_00335 [Tenericutes bacterium GWA2_35_7]OHE29605.1 MAG: hypothetical protein A2Y45_09620 [Tenericutes bacterium GWC2_34_14]OHE34185.1 MAG: hypothetical protein A2012_04925 [Tenericutes bacterium GWE2_34_108]OHE35516.1 MAG: hypothetical protein A2Y46_05290 [Tenericutes bacterium GWF1_35_14]OHE38565.1 MAG: hypothetical protein A2Y44_04180 [Tenericutes bacterium GWF2_35_184]OHE43743.1 MAG: hypothetical protein A2221_00295 [Tenericutes bacterium RIFOXYA2_FULL_36_3
MNKYDFKACDPIKTSTVVLITYTAIIGFIHGVGEIFQAGSQATSNMIYALNVADPSEVWHGGLPAFTLTPNFLISGILTILISIAIVIFVNLLIESKYFIFILLIFIPLFLFGGGFIPPFIGIMSGTYYAILKRSNMNTVKPTLLRKLVAQLWIYLISALILWLPSSWIIGWIFPVFRLQISSVTFIVFDLFLPFLILTAANSKYRIASN